MILCIDYVIPVSYTHLEEVKALKFKVPGGVATTIGGLIFLLFIIGLIGYHPVSYTHLDVYKRQGCYLAAPVSSSSNTSSASR